MAARARTTENGLPERMLVLISFIIYMLCFVHIMVIQVYQTYLWRAELNINHDSLYSPHRIIMDLHLNSNQLILKDVYSVLLQKRTVKPCHSSRCHITFSFLRISQSISLKFLFFFLAAIHEYSLPYQIFLGG